MSGPDMVGSGADAEPGTLFIDNAGLVLTHPMHRHLFERADLISRGSDGAWSLRNRRTAMQAAVLIQGLADPDPNPDPAMLALNRILCGLPPEMEEDTRIEPRSEEDQYRCEELLRAMRGHWHPFRHGTNESLRERFINRKAWLKPVDDGWVMRVEKHGFDGLLELLPWPFDEIRNDWMRAPLKVIW